MRGRAPGRHLQPELPWLGSAAGCFTAREASGSSFPGISDTENASLCPKCFRCFHCSLPFRKLLGKKSAFSPFYKPSNTSISEYFLPSLH